MRRTRLDLEPSAPGSRRGLLKLLSLGLLGAGLAPLARPRRASALEPRFFGLPEGTHTPEALLARTAELREAARRSGDHPYGALVARDGRIVGEAPSLVVQHGDPTAHAEMEAIRDAARRLGREGLKGCVLVSSAPPCPMCESAAYWAGISNMLHGAAQNRPAAPTLCR